MPFTVYMPKLSPTMTEGVVAKWHKHVGERVETGDVLLEISTDKATVEHAALDEGYLRAIVSKEGQTVQVNGPLAVFTEKLEESIEGYIPKPLSVEGPKPALAAKEVLLPPIMTAPKAQARVMASPLAKKLAKDR